MASTSSCGGIPARKAARPMGSTSSYPASPLATLAAPMASTTICADLLIATPVPMVAMARTTRCADLPLAVLAAGLCSSKPCSGAGSVDAR